MSSHGVEKQFRIATTWLLELGVAVVAACAAPGDVSRAPTDVGPPKQEPPGESPPVATGESYSVSGVLTLRTTSGAAPLAGATVGAFVILTNGRGYGLGPATTDADGRYQLYAPNGHVVLVAGAPHSYQPCAAIATVNGANSVTDIELVDSALTRPATTTDSPTLSGVVYRMTVAGRQPVAGAIIEFEYPPVIAATTITDAQGRYSLCQLPTGRGGVDIWLDGVALGGAVVYINGDQVLDFPVTR